MQRLFGRALQASADGSEEGEPNWPSADFWSEYALQIAQVHESPAKRGELTARLHETAARLATAGERDTTTACTEWIADDVLRFDPARIDYSDPSAEQRASLLTMHEQGRARDIVVVVDLYDVTLEAAMAQFARCSFRQIVDGVRLWSTLPRRVRSVLVVRPRCMSTFTWRSTFGNAKGLLSDKLKARMRVVLSRDELATHLARTESHPSRPPPPPDTDIIEAVNPR